MSEELLTITIYNISTNADYILSLNRINSLLKTNTINSVFEIINNDDEKMCTGLIIASTLQKIIGDLDYQNLVIKTDQDNRVSVSFFITKCDLEYSLLINPRKFSFNHLRKYLKNPANNLKKSNQELSNSLERKRLNNELQKFSVDNSLLSEIQPKTISNQNNISCNMFSDEKSLGSVISKFNMFLENNTKPIFNTSNAIEYDSEISWLTEENNSKYSEEEMWNFLLEKSGRGKQNLASPKSFVTSRSKFYKSKERGDSIHLSDSFNFPDKMQNFKSMEEMKSDKSAIKSVNDSCENNSINDSLTDPKKGNVPTQDKKPITASDSLNYDSGEIKIANKIIIAQNGKLYKDTSPKRYKDVFIKHYEKLLDNQKIRIGTKNKLDD